MHESNTRPENREVASEEKYLRQWAPDLPIRLETEDLRPIATILILESSPFD